MIKCPKCHTEARDFCDREGVDMNYCYDGCKGIWFDRGELAMYCETETNIPSQLPPFALAKATPFDCPKCTETKLVELPYLPGCDLMVDWCKQCHGVFLDSKELAKVESLASKYEKPSARIRRAANLLKEQGYEVFPIKR